MTCIVGIAHHGRVHIGGDSAGVAGYQISIRADAKVFRNGPYVMGFTTSFRMGQLLNHSLKAPHPTGNLERFMATTFVDAARECLRSGGYLKSENGVDSGGTFLVGVNGRLFEIANDFQVGENADGWAAIGCGDDIALGSLHATQGQPPLGRITSALEAASHYSAGVSAPYVIKSTKETK